MTSGSRLFGILLVGSLLPLLSKAFTLSSCRSIAFLLQDGAAEYAGGVYKSSFTKCGPSKGPSSVLHLTTRDFGEFGDMISEITNESPVLVDFFANWCGPCQALKPELEKVARKLEGKLVVAGVDVDKNQETADRLDIRGLPTLIVFGKGAEVKLRIEGFRPAEDLIREVEKVI